MTRVLRKLSLAQSFRCERVEEDRRLWNALNKQHSKELKVGHQMHFGCFLNSVTEKIRTRKQNADQTQVFEGQQSYFRHA